MNNDRLKKLLNAYFDSSINPEDCSELLDYLNHADPSRYTNVIDAVLENKVDAKGDVRFTSEQHRDIFNRIKSDPSFSQSRSSHKIITSKRKLNQKVWFQIAAAVLCCLGTFLFFAGYFSPEKQRSVATVKSKEDILLPDNNQASLQLADGTWIALDSVKDDVINTLGNMSLNKEKGELKYKSTDERNNGEIVYHTIHTPKGSDYSVVLPDGTKVWLNSSSSLQFPVQFRSDSRTVKLTGEAYFEVAKKSRGTSTGNESSSNIPFKVISKNQEIMVLGTHFNVSAYDGEATKTTLLTGKVQISSLKETGEQVATKELKPGEQANILPSLNEFTIKKVKVNDAIAWKNGYFKFKDENIYTILQKIRKWYEIEDIEYKANFDDLRFGGSFYRSKSVHELLSHLEKLGPIRFEIKGRRIIVMK